MSVPSATEVANIAAVQKSTIGAEIITKTLDTMNQYGSTGTGGNAGTSGDMAASYEFQKSVLSAAYSPKGAVADVTS